MRPRRNPILNPANSWVNTTFKPWFNNQFKTFTPAKNKSGGSRQHRNQNKIYELEPLIVTAKRQHRYYVNKTKIRTQSQRNRQSTRGRYYFK